MKRLSAVALFRPSDCRVVLSNMACWKPSALYLSCKGTSSFHCTAQRVLAL